MMLRLLAFIMVASSIANAAPLVASNGDEVQDLAAFCKSLDTARECMIGDADKIADLAKPVAPYQAARIFWAGESITGPSNECYLGIETPHGWTVARLDSDCWANGKYYRRIDVKDFSVRGSTLWLRYESESTDPDAPETVTGDFLVICGLSDGLPRCTAPIELGLAVDGKPMWKVKATLAKAGALVLELQKGKRAALPSETAALLGKRSLSFE